MHFSSLSLIYGTVIFLLLSNYVQLLPRKRSKDRKLLQCFHCGAYELNCHTHCIGYYCFENEFKTKDGVLVRRGCLNYTDSDIPENGCEEKVTKLPRSDIITSERFCVCQKTNCNTSSVPRTLLMPLIAVSFAVFCR
ncbi:hypothetical protein AB6A40_006499 [Gnathostoma spinigerum]|uniref:Uncharacterized protein n=1 Tax=Gnathostoma spinigerum TaxID=75299 RepID=A0ABD6EIJ0_9BILA